MAFSLDARGDRVEVGGVDRRTIREDGATALPPGLNERLLDN
jgi:hypothetical protein